MMHCPLSGSPCIMPKEIFVTEVHQEGVKHLFMCRLCGDEYIKKLQNADVVTKSIEVVSSDGNVSRSEHVLEESDEQSDADRLNDVSQSNRPRPNQLKAVEAKMQAAIDREDYETAAKLRDVLNDLRQKIAINDNQNQSG